MSPFKKGSGIKRYYTGIDRRTKGTAYEFGRDFEYRTMATLRSKGWHCMRRFGSQGVVFCAKCFKNVSRRTMKCPKHGTKFVMKASLDVTAFRNGVYLLITCKASRSHGTVYIDDIYWRNLAIYAAHYGAIPIFAGHSPPPNSKVYLVDLRTKIEFLKWTYRYPSTNRPKQAHVSRLLDEAWRVVDRANLVLGHSEIACPKCKHKFDAPFSADTDKKAQARWSEVKIKMLNVINKLLWRSGAWQATEDDLSKILTKSESILKEETLKKAAKQQ